MAKSTDIGQLRNLGPKSTAWLDSIGIASLEDLERAGVVLAFKMVEDQGYAPSLNLLYALEGAITGRHWNRISAQRKGELRSEVGRSG